MARWRLGDGGGQGEGGGAEEEGAAREEGAAATAGYGCLKRRDGRAGQGEEGVGWVRVLGAVEMEEVRKREEAPRRRTPGEGGVSGRSGRGIGGERLLLVLYVLHQLLKSTEAGLDLIEGVVQRLNLT